MALVRIVVKLKDEQAEVSYISFDWNLFKAPLPVKGDELAFGNCLLLVQGRRYHAQTDDEAPRVTLHAGLTGVWARKPVTAPMMLELLQDYPTVTVLG